MKKLLLLLLLCPLLAMAEFYPGTITFNDGTTKTGLIEIPSNYNRVKVKFRADKKADTEKFSIDDVKQFTVTVDKNQSTYVTLKYGYYRPGSKKYKFSDEKIWARIEKEGKISILTAYSIDTGHHYYLHKSGEDCCYYIASFYGGFAFSVGEFKAIKTYTASIFKDDCPQLADSITKEEYKKKSLDVIVDNYMELCGK